MDTSGETVSRRSLNGPRTEFACTGCQKVKKKCHQDRDPNVPCLRCKTKGMHCIRTGSVPNALPPLTITTNSTTSDYTRAQASGPPESPYRNSQALQRSISLSSPVNGQWPVNTTANPSAMDYSLPPQNTSYHGSQIYQGFSSTDPTLGARGMQIETGQRMFTAQYGELTGAFTSTRAFYSNMGREEIPISSSAPDNGDSHGFLGSLLVGYGERASMPPETEAHVPHPSVRSSDQGEGVGYDYGYGNIGTS